MAAHDLLWPEIPFIGKVILAYATGNKIYITNYVLSFGVILILGSFDLFLYYIFL